MFSFTRAGLPFNEATRLLRHHTLQLLNSIGGIQMAMWYIIWGVLAYVMTLGKSNRKARDWVFTGQIMILAVEVAIVTTTGEGGVLPSWLFPGMAEYEVCEKSNQFSSCEICCVNFD